VLILSYTPICIHTHTHTCTHAYTHTHVHTQTHIHTCSFKPACRYEKRKSYIAVDDMPEDNDAHSSYEQQEEVVGQELVEQARSRSGDDPKASVDVGSSSVSEVGVCVRMCVVCACVHVCAYK
jgi:hypothetical protein